MLEEKNSVLGTELEISNRKKVQIERDFEKLKTQVGLDEGNWGEYQKKIDALKKQNAELEINNSELVGKNMVDGRKLMEVLKLKSDWEVERDSLSTQIRLLKSNIGETQLSTEEVERLNKRVSEETSKADQYLAEKNSYYEDLKKYKTKCDKATAANTAMKLTFACVESEKNRLLSDKTELQDKFDATENELDDLKSKTEIERSGLDAQVKNLGKERDSLAEKNKKLAGKSGIKEKELNSTNTKLADEISKLKDELSDLGQEKAELVMNYNDIKNKFKDSVELADRQRDRAKEGDTKAQDVRKKNETLNAEILSIKKRLKDFETGAEKTKLNKTLESENEDLALRLVAAKSEIFQLTTKIQDLKHSTEMHPQRIQSASSDLQALFTRELQTKDLELAALHQANNDLTSENINLTAKIHQSLLKKSFTTTVNPPSSSNLSNTVWETKYKEQSEELSRTR